jgi:nondiscriminating aspartyl-tRNA synthetase
MSDFINLNQVQSDYSDLTHAEMGQFVCFYGMIQNIRVTKWGGFIIVRKPDGLIQTVIQKETSSIVDEMGNAIGINDITREMAVSVRGVVNAANIKDKSVKYNNIEVSVTGLQVVSRPSTTNIIDVNSLKFSDEESVLKYKFDHRQVSLRNPKDMAIFRVSSTIAQSFAEYLISVGFTQIFTPKIVSEGAEGGANVFKMDYFGKEVYLAQSPQFYKQIGVGIFGRVFEIAPAYRAEKHNTSRHLNEFISLDVEMGFIKDQEEVMELEMNLLRFILDSVRQKCEHEIKLLDAQLPSLPDRVPVYRLSEAHELLYREQLTSDHRGEDDMAPEEERAICRFAKEKFGSDFVFITHFPAEHRAFYAMNDPQNPSLTLSFDLLMSGIEITSGGQRIHKEEDYRSKMIERGMNPDNFKFYLDTFRNGMPPHGGFAIGLERLTAFFLGISNVKEASMFPRDINRVAP